MMFLKRSGPIAYFSLISFYVPLPIVIEFWFISSSATNTTVRQAQEGDCPCHCETVSSTKTEQSLVGIAQHTDNISAPLSAYPARQTQNTCVVNISPS